MRRAGLVVGRTLETLRASVRPGVSTRELDAVAEDSIRVGRRDAVVLGLSRRSPLRSASRSTTRWSTASRGTGCSPTVTWSRSTVAPSSTAGTATPRSPSASARCPEPGGADAGHRGRAVARHRRGPSRRPRHRHLPRRRDRTSAIAATTASSRTTSATASGRRCTSRPNVPNYGRPGRGPRLVPGLALAVEPMVTLGTPRRCVLDDDWTVVTTDGRPAAHAEHTSP